LAGLPMPVNKSYYQITKHHQGQPKASQVKVLPADLLSSSVCCIKAIKL